MESAITWILSLLGAVGALISIQDYYLKHTKNQEIPSIEINPQQDGDSVVLMIDSKDKDISGTLTNNIYKFVKEYGPSQDMQHYFIYNPKGHYIAGRVLFIQLSFIGIVLLLFPMAILFTGADVSSGKKMFLAGLFIFGVMFFIYSIKTYQRNTIIKKYIEFLSANGISVGYTMIQKRSHYEKKLTKQSSGSAKGAL